jgi:hypothetical protein
MHACERQHTLAVVALELEELLEVRLAENLSRQQKA